MSSLMSRFKRKDETDEMLNYETNDILIVFDDEKKTSDIRRINKITDDAVMVIGTYNVPLADCEVTNSTQGRNFFYRAPAKSVEHTKSLADLEKKLVLRKITQFKTDELPPVDLSKYMMIGGLIIALIIALFV